MTLDPTDKGVRVRNYAHAHERNLAISRMRVV